MTSLNRLPGQANCDRRGFLAAVGLAASVLPASRPLLAAPPTMKSGAEEAAARLFRTLSPEQKRTIAFSWDHQDKDRGLLRTFVSNNWQVTPAHIRSDFYSAAQQTLAREVFEQLVAPSWLPKFLQQLKDDTEGKPWGNELSLAFFGEPQDKFQMVLTGRHLTLRADGAVCPRQLSGAPFFTATRAKASMKRRITREMFSGRRRCLPIAFSRC